MLCLGERQPEYLIPKQPRDVMVILQLIEGLVLSGVPSHTDDLVMAREIPLEFLHHQAVLPLLCRLFQQWDNVSIYVVIERFHALMHIVTYH